jgi:hypothetical protein
MSAPAVTGAVALMLQADPTLTPAQIRDIIRQTAITDNYTGTIPPGGSTRWGMGKLNAYHAVTQLLGVTGVNEAGEPHLSVWPNPASGMLFVSPPFATDGAQLYVTDALGRTVLSRALNSSGAFSVDGSGWPSGVYFLRMEKEGQCAVGKVVRE